MDVGECALSACDPHIAIRQQLKQRRGEGRGVVGVHDEAVAQHLRGRRRGDKYTNDERRGGKARCYRLS